MRTQYVAQCRPVPRVTALLETVADEAHQLVSKQRDENMAVDPPLKAMKVRPEPKLALYTAKTRLCLGQHHVAAPEFDRRHRRRMGL